MLMKKIAAIEFTVLSPEQIRKMSALEIKTPETYDKDGYPMEGGLMDPHLGVINPGLRCKTCGQRMKDCPGHFGSLELVRPVLHPEYSRKVEELIHATCQSCGRISISDEKLHVLAEEAKIYPEAIYKKIVTKGKKTTKCPHCGSGRGQIMLDRPTNFYLNKERIYPTQIREWVEKINDDDLKLLGYHPERVRPEWFVMTVVAVPPITIRPSITLESGIKSEDDLTHKLVDIVRINDRLRDNIEAGAPQLIIEDLWDLLQYHVTTYFDNNTAGVPPAKHRSGRALRTLVQRLKGKKGRFRYNLTGKRVNFAARSTISPDPFISINEVGVPEAIARELTVPEFVTEWNKKKLEELIRKTDKVIYLMRPNGVRKKVTEENREDVITEMDVGFKVERQLMDGDIVVFNRQPSLHRLSMMGHRARIMPHKTLRINPIVCVGPDTQVNLDSGTGHRIAGLERTWPTEEIQTTDTQSGQTIRTPIADFWKVSPQSLGKKCFRITTQETGRTVEATGDHPFYCASGIVTAERLAPNDRVIVRPSDYAPVTTADTVLFTKEKALLACPAETYSKLVVKTLSERGLLGLRLDDSKSRILARLLGHLLGDG
ncbi:MAG: hypothetical protein Q7R47_06045, partial [Candidatus Diapherotrites archaeon]|nr:hypothetical protein [Candidatus Diapherotrites archaeon]